MSQESNRVSSEITYNNVTIITSENVIGVTQPVTNVIEIATLGPQGPQGPQGPPGTTDLFTFIGNDTYSTTSSLEISGSLFVNQLIYGTASWAINALTASYIPLLAGPNITINYQPDGIAITGSGGGGTPGAPEASIQFNSSSTFSGSPNFLFITGNNTLLLTGSLFVTGSTIISGNLIINSSFPTQAQPAFQINNDGLLIIGEYTSHPSAITGALIYSSSEYYLGFQ